MTDRQPVTVSFTAEWTAAYDTLLAIEGFATRAYADRETSPKAKARYNALAPIVLALRDAVDRRP